MSVRHALLALLTEGPKYGLQLRQEFEARTGEVWPLNVGQVYTTLQRLERDGHAESENGDRDGAQKKFRITEAGAARAGPLAAHPTRCGCRHRGRAGDEGSGRGAAARRRRARDPAGPPASVGGGDAALHDVEGGVVAGRRRAGAGRRRGAVPAGGGGPLARRRRRPTASPAASNLLQRAASRRLLPPPRRIRAADVEPADERRAEPAPSVQSVRFGVRLRSPPCTRSTSRSRPASWWPSWGRAAQGRARY